MRTVGWMVLVSLVSCAPAEDEPVAARADPIIGGTPTGTADPQVFALLRYGSPFCSSTLIHPRVLLTAAHCVADPFSYVSNHPLGYSSGAWAVSTTWAHPGYEVQGTGEYDLALVLLTSPVTSVTPKRVQRSALPTLASGRAVGYGQRSTSGTNPPYGERYTIDLPITAVLAGQVRYGSPGAAVCYGDSGGPFFATIGGVETVIAVHSYTNDPTCSGGAGARVDRNIGALEAWFATNVCPRDGACDPDCLAVDYDCTCGADGQCTAACTRPELDVDCPANCAADDICAVQACPIPDVDCRAAGARCERANQCQGQRCTSDPQHPDLYCSMPCATLADCAGLDQSECVQGTCRLVQVTEIAEGAPCQPGDRCANGTQCHGLDATHSYCAKPCSRQSDCPADKECRAGFSTWKACVAKLPPPPVTLESASSVELPAAAKGCSTSGSLLLLGLSALLARRRRLG